MTNQEINERIAKMCGWTREEYGAKFWRSPNYQFENQFAPNYTESLDACREFIEQLHGTDRDDFCSEVLKLDRLETKYEFEFWWAMISLTPLELCEAFLRLKGQWE